MPTTRTRFVLKIVVLVSSILAAAIGVYLVVCMFSGIENYYTQHFGLASVLLLVSPIALILPILTKKKYQEDSKDKIMFVIGVLLIMFAVLTVAISYMNIF